MDYTNTHYATLFMHIQIFVFTDSKKDHTAKTKEINDAEHKYMNARPPPKLSIFCRP